MYFKTEKDEGRGRSRKGIKRTKSRRKKKKLKKKVRVMIKAGERDERIKDWIFCPHPPEKGLGKRRERCWRDETRARAYLHASVHTCTTRPAGRRHRAEKVIPQSGMATEAPAQWYPFVKAVAIKGP